MKSYIIPDKPKLKQLAIDGLIISSLGLVLAAALTLNVGMRFYLWVRHWTGELFGERELP